MKPGFLRFRGKEFPLLLIVIIGTTIVIWTSNRTPFLTSLLPPKQQSQLSQVFSEPNIRPRNDVATNDRNPLSVYSPTNSTEEEETPPAADDTEAKDKQVTEVAENDGGEQAIVTGTEGKHNENVEEKSINGEEHPPGLISAEASANTSSSVTKTGDRDNQFVELEESNSATNIHSSQAEEKDLQKLKEEAFKQKDQHLDLAAPLVPGNVSSQLVKQDEKNFTMLVTDQACNFAKGKWVIDDSLPLYSGLGCKQWLAPMWACRLMQRTDFSYEKLRWQPNNCEMESFEGAKFFKRLQGKTLAFVGDSLGRQQFQSLMCMITGGKESPDVLDVGIEFGLVKPRGGVRPNGWAYRFPSTNTTILYYWSACLCDLEPIDVNNPETDYAMHLDRPPSFLRHFLHKIDILVLNTGHHWNRGKLKANRWVMHVGGMPNTNKKLAMIGDAKNFTIHSIVDWVNQQLPKNPHLKAFYRSISPRHFVNGDWNTGGSCDNTTPMSIGKEVVQEESSDYSAGHAVRGTGVKLLDITALSQLRDEGHISRYRLTASAAVQDCLHWCLPGVPDTWNEILFAVINDMSELQNE